MADFTRAEKGPLIYSELYRINDVVFWDKTRPPVIGPRDDDTPYLVRDDDRLDLMAYRLLGNSRMGHIILSRNGFSEPEELVPGEIILIPSLEGLKSRGIV